MAPAGRVMTLHKPRPFTLEALRAYLAEIFPEVWAQGDYSIEEAGPMRATVRLRRHPGHLRPGGTISGPAMFALCDLALYVAILNEIGRVKLAVTTNMSINFLRRPEPFKYLWSARDRINSRLLLSSAVMPEPQARVA